jgi:hypothetical protein
VSFPEPSDRFVDAAAEHAAPRSITPVLARSANGVAPSEHHSSATTDRLRPVFRQRLHPRLGPFPACRGDRLAPPLGQCLGPTFGEGKSPPDMHQQSDSRRPSFSFLNFFLSVLMRLLHFDSEKYPAQRPSAAAARWSTSSHSSARMPRRTEQMWRSP